MFRVVFILGIFGSIYLNLQAVEEQTVKDELQKSLSLQQTIVKAPTGSWKKYWQEQIKTPEGRAALERDFFLNYEKAAELILSDEKIIPDFDYSAMGFFIEPYYEYARQTGRKHIVAYYLSAALNGDSGSLQEEYKKGKDKIDYWRELQLARVLVAKYSNYFSQDLISVFKENPEKVMSLFLMDWMEVQTSPKFPEHLRRLIECDRSIIKNISRRQKMQLMLTVIGYSIHNDLINDIENLKKQDLFIFLANELKGYRVTIYDNFLQNRALDIKPDQKNKDKFQIFLQSEGIVY